MKLSIPSRTRRAVDQHKRELEWHYKFALWPRRINEDTVLWLELYQRRKVLTKSTTMFDATWRWEYRRIVDAVKARLTEEPPR